MTTLKISTLGGLALQRGAAPVSGFISRKVDALLVYLACNPREHPREVLAEMLWDDLPQARTMANLRTALSSLQQQLGDYLIITRHALGINLQSGVWVDALELDNALTEADKAWRQHSAFSRAVLARLQDALALYRGPFLDGFHLREARGFEEWAVLEQERLRSRVLEGYARLVQNALSRGQHEDGIAYAARLLQLAPGWEETHRQMMLLLALSGQRTAALEQYEQCRRILRDELDVEPDEETTALYKRIQSGDIAPAAPITLHHNLPSIATPFIDRPDELAHIVTQLEDPNCRLLTLVGPGGIGKTRLAIEAARSQLENFRQGTYFVPLDSVDTPDYLAMAIANAIKSGVQGEIANTNDLLRHLEAAEMLLVLDNIEHLLDGVDLLSQILTRAPGVKILVTSRERLNLQEEWLLPVDGLPFPHDDHAPDAAAYASVQMFVQSGRRVRADFAQDGLNGQTASVARICRLVEGMPLGIELAASWLRVMTPQQVAAQIEHDLDFLATSLRNVPERHRSLRVLFEQSVNALTPPERTALFRLSVFRGGFDHDAAKQVAGASLPILASLSEKSLIRFHPSGRCDMHELLRRYSGEKLEATGTLREVQNTHCDYFTARAEVAAKNDDEAWIETEYSNLRLALGWAVENARAETLICLVDSLAVYWRVQGYLDEGRYWATQALEFVDDTLPPELRAMAFSSAGIIAWNQGDFEAAHGWLASSLELYRQLEDQNGISRALRYLGYVLMNTGQFEAAKQCYEDMLVLAVEARDPVMMLTASGNLGQVMSDTGDFENGQVYLMESLSLARSAGRQQNVCVLLTNLGNLFLARHDYLAAQSCYEEALPIGQAIKARGHITFLIINMGEVAHNLGNLAAAMEHYQQGLRELREMGDKLSLTATLESFAYVLVDTAEAGDAQLAARLLGAAEALREGLQAPIPPREKGRYDKYLARLRERLGESDLLHLWRTGRALSLDHAVALALGYAYSIA